MYKNILRHNNINSLILKFINMETTEKQQPKQNIRIERIFGILLLIPPILSVLLFLINLIIKEPGNIAELSNLSRKWTGALDYNYEVGGGGGYTSAAPIYFGLMAIAGALLLKGTDKK